jgi:hypothetical protein
MAHIAERYVIASHHSVEVDEFIAASRASRGMPKMDRAVIAAEWGAEKAQSKRSAIEPSVE